LLSNAEVLRNYLYQGFIGFAVDWFFLEVN
jgi:hypothetical protein